ncbi:MAG: hypothetical protein LBN24_08000 [Mediterranea sp.]|jgi:hypothetical protein|nr:hypothetical protein [Mediterranea sp.]
MKENEKKKRIYESPSVQAHVVELEAAILIVSSREASTDNTPVQHDWGDETEIDGSTLTY